MNCDERRALNILLGEGYKIDEGEFRKWCLGKKSYFNSSAGSLWCRFTKERIAQEWRSEHGQT
jgi:hypothetical protein